MLPEPRPNADSMWTSADTTTAVLRAAVTEALGAHEEQFVLQKAAGDRIDGTERLVHQQHGRICGQGPRHLYACC